MEAMSPQPSLVNPGTLTKTLVYVVDDERNIADVVQQILAREGFEAVVFSNPIEALDALTKTTHKPEVLVTDFAMEPMDGMELIIKCRAVHPSIRTLLFSGNVNGRITDLYSQRPNVFLEKPFQPDNLVQAVRNLLSMPSDGAYDA